MVLKQIKVEKDELVFDETTRISFERTLRIPDDGKIYPLPPSFGHFPICKVDDYIEKVPESWKKTGGVFIPMWQREAMWMQFTAKAQMPRAVKVAIGKVNAVSGKPWDQKISSENDDYVVIPDQPWIDGINTGEGQIKQFVAMELGKGYTVEAQVTGKEEFGGIQLIVYDPKPGKIRPAPAPVSRSTSNPFSFYKKEETFYEDEAEDESLGDFEGATSSALDSLSLQSESLANSSMVFKKSAQRMSSPVKYEEKESRKAKPSAAKEMGLAAGGKMSQKIYKDPYGSDCWDENNFQRIYVRIVNSAMYEQITGKQPPQTPIDASAYTNFGYTWFHQYDENAQSVASSSELQNVKSVKEIDQQKYAWPQQDDSSVNISGSQVISFKKADPGAVRDGDW